MSKFIDLLLPWREATDDQISDGFVYIIGAVFLLFGFYFFVRTFIQRRLICGLTKEIRKYDSPAKPRHLPELREKFSNKGNFAVMEKFSGKVKLTEAWQEFEYSLITRERDENKSVAYKTDEASLFFGEDRLLEQHLNLRFWNSVPALLVGFGILGTFIGLVWGLKSFSGVNFTQTAEIRTAIKTLLSGVSTAFVTSVWGMLTSLVFNGLEKWRIGRASQAIVNLQRALDRLFTLTTQEAISFRQEDELAQQTAALKSFSTDLADRIKIAMDNIMSERLENLHQGLKQLHDHNLEGRIAIIKELQNAPEAFGNAMAEQLEPSLRSLNTAVEGLRRQKEESSTDAIQQLVEEFRNSISESTTKQLEGLAQTVNSASESLTTLPEKLASMMESVQEQIDHSRQLLADTSQNQSGQMKSMMDEMLKAFQNASDTHQSRLSATTNSANEEITRIAADIRNLLESTANRADEQLAQRIAEIEGVSTQSIQTLEGTIAELQRALTSTASQTAEESQGMVTRMLDLLESAANRADAQLAQRIAEIDGVSTQSIQTLETTIAELRQSLTSTLDAQQQTIRRITSQTEAASVESTDGIRQLVEQSAGRLESILKAGEQSVSALLNQQGDQIRAINDQIANSQETLARGRDMLEQMNTTVTSVREMIETTQTLSSRLMLGADRLETAGRQLTLASSAFNQENENYLSANRETTQQLQGTLVQSRELLNDFAQRFQTIDAGLQGIFSEIQRGLDAYASVSNETITSYLGDFSSLVTNAVNSLAVSIEALRGLVEELSDSIERFRRR